MLEVEVYRIFRADENLSVVKDEEEKDGDYNKRSKRGCCTRLQETCVAVCPFWAQLVRECSYLVRWCLEFVELAKKKKDYTITSRSSCSNVFFFGPKVSK